MNGLEYVHALKEGKIKSSSFVQELNLSIVAIEKGIVEMEAKLNPRFASSRGILLGGISASMLDFVMGMAVVSSLGDNMGTFTLEMKVNYIKAIKISLGHIKITGNVLRSGRTISHVEGIVEDCNGNPYAKGTGTFIIMPDSGLDSVAGKSLR